MIRMLFSLLTIGIWMPILLVFVSIMAFSQSNVVLYVIAGSIVKLALWCSAFYDWHDADKETKNFRPKLCKCTKCNVWDIE